MKTKRTYKAAGHTIVVWEEYGRYFVTEKITGVDYDSFDNLEDAIKSAKHIKALYEVKERLLA